MAVEPIKFYKFLKLYDSSGWAMAIDVDKYASIMTSPEDRIIFLSLMHHYNTGSCTEFGVNDGLTASMLLKHCSFIERYVGIDVPYGFSTKIKVQLSEVPMHAGEKALNDNRFELHVLSNGTEDIDANEWENLFDYVFIDADHSYSGVMRDTEIAMRIVKRGGIILWHDYKPIMDGGPCETMEAIDVLSDRYNITHVVGTCTCFGVVDK